MNEQSTMVNQALGFHQHGQFAQARELYERALSANANNAEALHLLGALELQTGNSELAVDLLQRAGNLDPDNAPVFANLGNAFFAVSNLHKAIAAYEKSLELDVNVAQTWAALGNARFASGALEDAAGHYEQALRLNDSLTEVWRCLASTLLTLGSPERAMEAVERADHTCVRSGQPVSLPLLVTRGNILMGLGQPQEALEVFNQVVTVAPDFGQGYLNLGGAYRELGDIERALEQYSRTLALDPDSAQAYYARALIEQEQGQLEKARASLHSALQYDPQLGKAYRILASLTSFSKDDPQLNAMRTLIEDPQLPDEQRKHVCFALGKGLDDCRLYDDAFAQISRGNKLHRQSFRYSIEDEERYLEEIAAVFNVDYMQKHVGEFSGNADSPVPVFVIGMPRSGTSLVEQILASHPDVHGAGELDFIERAAHEVLVNRSGTQEGSKAPVNLSMIERLTRLSHASRETLLDIGKVYRRQVQGLSPGSLRIVDKMPANFLRAGLIHLALPDAVIIHCERNPLATCWSVYKNFIGALGHAYSFDQNELGQYYRLYLKLMDHWEQVMPGVIYRVQYEDLVNNQEHITRQLIRHCGLSWDDACLDFYATVRPVKTLSASQVRKPMYTDSLQQWQHYARHLEPLQSALKMPAK